MKKSVLCLSVVAAVAAAVALGAAEPGRKLVWSDEFNGTCLDTNRWIRLDKGSAPWRKHMSLRPDLVEMKDGALVLWGVANSDLSADERPCTAAGRT